MQQKKIKNAQKCERPHARNSIYLGTTTKHATQQKLGVRVEQKTKHELYKPTTQHVSITSHLKEEMAQVIHDNVLLPVLCHVPPSRVGRRRAGGG